MRVYSLFNTPVRIIFDTNRLRTLSSVNDYYLPLPPDNKNTWNFIIYLRPLQSIKPERVLLFRPINSPVLYLLVYVIYIVCMYFFSSCRHFTF